MRYLGIDLHSNNFTACFLSEDGTHTFEKWRLFRFCVSGDNQLPDFSGEDYATD
jgi:hypothetical protein